LGLDAALVLRFDRALSLLSPEDFSPADSDRAVARCGHVGGREFLFGHRGAGDVRLLAQFGKDHGFEVRPFRPWKLVELSCQAPRFGTRLPRGALTRPVPLLAIHFRYGGDSPGAGRGRTILFPTLNLVPEQELLPKLRGVCDRVGRRRERLSIGDECGYAAHVSTDRRYRGEPLVRIQRTDYSRGDGGPLSFAASAMNESFPARTNCGGRSRGIL